jgi:uncharacterized membrane protein
MLGFVVGSVCLIALFKMRHMRRMYAYGYGHRHGCEHGSYEDAEGGHPFRGNPFGGNPFRGHRQGRGFGFGPFAGGGRRAMLYRLFQALEATPGQEKVIVAAIDEVQAAARESRGELKQSRVDLAQALRADSFDAVIMGNAFARHDEHIERMRKAVVGALAKVHDALDEKQRARLAEWLDAAGGTGPFGGFGVYR